MPCLAARDVRRVYAACCLTSAVRPHTRRMGRRRDPQEAVRREGGEEFAFLIAEGDFIGPEEIKEGLIYYRSGIRIEVRRLGPREPEVVTKVCLETGGGVARS